MAFSPGITNFDISWNKSCLSSITIEEPLVGEAEVRLLYCEHHRISTTRTDHVIDVNGAVAVGATRIFGFVSASGKTLGECG